MLRGDSITVHDKHDDRVFHKGYVVFVNLDHIVVNLRFKPSRTKSFHVIFGFSETVYRREMQALLDATTLLTFDSPELIEEPPAVKDSYVALAHCDKLNSLQQEA